ncbi:fibronectin type III domain-containing protein [Aureivirga marina]|uniref:fibronectin type III domain-containing protein n=1 Tax=Aureivirga marina TaxID=1182451 RepID=UPI0018C9D59D|nr:fibronectin type III domain-containing protein [Aureivirga marina]
MKKITLLFFLLTLPLLSWKAQAQCPDGETTVHLSVYGGSGFGEEWVSITSEENGEGDVIWQQGDEIGENSGTIEVDICIPTGQTLYINAYDKFDGGWEGVKYKLTDPSGTIVIADNGDVSPDDGNEDGSSAAWTDDDIEVSEEFMYTPPTCPAPSNIDVTAMATTADITWATGSATAWEIIVQEEGEAAPGDDTTGTDVDTTPSYSATSLTENTSYTIYVRDVCAADDKSSWTSMTFTTPYACPFPTELNVSGITGEGATVTWVTGGSTTWEIIIQTAGNDAPTETSTGTEVTTTSSYEASDLNGVTQYEVYVRDICSDDEKSLWTGPFSFETLCATVIPYYNQNFASYIPNCWEEATGGTVTTGPATFTGNSWIQDDFGNDTGHINGKSARYELWQSGAMDWLVSPTFEIPADEAHELNFDIALTKWNNTDSEPLGGEHYVHLLYTNDGGTTWNTIQTWDSDSVVSNTGDNINISLETITGTVRFAFLAQEIAEGGDANFYVDNFSVRTPPTCPVPSELTLGNISDTTAEISWTTGGATSWDVIYLTAGSPFPSEDATTNVSTTTVNTNYEVTGLSPVTEYDVYVRDICADDDKSYWVGPITFTTECAAFDITYVENYDEYIPNCWEEATAGTLTDGPENFGSSVWTQDDFGNNTTGANGESARTNLFGSGSLQWLISPLIIVPNDGSTYQVNYDAALTGFSNQNEAEIGAGHAVYVLYKLQSETEWTTIATYNSTTTVSNTGQNDSAYLEGISGTVQIAFVSEELASGGDTNFYIDNFKIEQAPTCLTPNGLIAGSITANTAELEWNGGNGESWDIVIQEEGAGAPDDTTVPTVEAHTEQTYTVTALTSNTTYEYYIQSNCAGDDESIWVGPFVFSTPCDNLMPAYNQDFTTYLPDCWSEGNGGSIADGPSNTNDNDDWEQDSFGNDDTNAFGQSAKVQLSGSGGKGWLISPNFDIPDTDLHEVRFDIALTNFSTGSTTMDSDHSVTLLYTNDLGATWNTLVTWNGDSVISNTGQEEFAYLNGVSGTVQFAFFADESAWGSTSNFFIDNFKVQLAPSCQQPTELEGTVLSGTEATLVWNGGNGTSWDIVIQDAGTGTPTETTTITVEDHDATTYDATTLTPLTDYEYYVRSTCSDTEDSFWSGPFTFSTPCANYTPEYLEQFETFLAECWEEGTAGTLTEGPDSIGSASWTGDDFVNDTSHMNVRSAKINIFGSSGSYNWLISPNIDIPDTETHEVSFDLGLTSWNNTNEATLGESQTVNLLYTNDGGTTWNTLKTWDNTTPISNTGQFEFVTLDGISGVVKFAMVTLSQSSGDVDFFMDNFRVRIAPSCIQPTNLIVDNILATSADIEWTAGSGSSWDIIIQTANFDDPNADSTPTVAQHDATSYEATGLEPSTLYEVYVRDYCSADDQSFWTGPYTFTTPCADFNEIPYLEGFNSFTASEECWTVLNANTDSDEWDLDFDGTFSEGDQSASLKTDLNNGNNNDFLVSPGINLTGDDILRFKFKVGSEIQGDKFQILVSEENNFDLYTPDADGNDATNGITVLLAAPNDVYSNIEFEQVEIDLSSMSGVHFFAWHVPNTPGEDGTSITIDDVKFIPTPNCTAPTNIMTSDITDTSATLSWDDPGNVGNFDVAAVPFGAGLPTTWTEVTATSYNFTGLDPNTKYDLYVRSVCEDNINESEWSDPQHIKTACGVIDSLPWIEDFEAMEEVGVDILPECMEGEGVYYMSLDQPATFNRSAYSGDNYVAIDFNSDAWIKTPYFNLDKDKNYKLKFKYSTSGFAGFQFSAWFGTSRDVSSYEGHPIGFTMGDDAGEQLVNEEYVEYSAVFSPLESGNHSIGLHFVSDNIAFFLNIDDIELEETTDEVTNPINIGVDDFALEGLNLYPNPTSDILNVEYQKSIDAISIVNLLGQEVINIAPNTNKQRIDLSELATGTYIVKVVSGNDFGTYKIMKN